MNPTPFGSENSGNQEGTNYGPITQKLFLSDRQRTPEQNTDNEILESLAFPQMLDRRDNIEPYHTNTCEWILDLEEYQSWKKQSHGLLWIKGKPGAGKSTLMAFLHDKLQISQDDRPGIRLGFFFTGLGTEMQRTPLGMLRSLLNQIFNRDPTIRPQIREIYEQQYKQFGHGKHQWEWPQVMLEELLASAILASANRQNVVVFVDALDEAGAESAQQLANYFHQLIDRAKKKKLCLQVCISCRHYPIMEIGQAIEITVENHNQEDITTYIRDILFKTETKNNATQKTREMLVKQLTQSSNGVFQWAHIIIPLVEQKVRKRESFDDICRWLRETPDHLEDLDDTKSSIGDHTDIESIFSMESTSSMQSSQPEIASIAISELVRLLLDDDQLMVLYSTAISKVGLEKFERNFARMLKRYGWNLNDEASNQRQREAAHFVRSSARRTAAEVRVKLMEDRSELPFEKKPESTRSKLARVNEWLESRMGGRSDWYADADNSSADSDSAGSEIFEPTSLATLEEVKEFMILTKAFSDLRRDFQLWLEGKGRHGHERPNEKISDSNSAQGRLLNGVSQPALLDGSSGGFPQRLQYTDFPSEDILTTYTMTTKVTRLSSWWLWLMDSYAPPAAGYQRIWYTCGCGELCFLDVRELSTGGIERFRQRLLNNVMAARTHPQSSLGLANLEYPPQAHLDPVSSTTMTTENIMPLRVPNKPPSQSTTPGITQTGSMTSWNQDPQFLLICINTKSSTALIHIEVGPQTNDQYLFQQMYQQYQNVKREEEFRLSMIFPSWIRTFFRGFSMRLPRPSSSSRLRSFLSMLRCTIPEMRLFKIASGDFVRFSLIPIGIKCCPRWFKTKEFPPEAEVRAKRYVYEPVPMEDVELVDIPLSHLLKPGPHTDRFWITTFPKKLRDPLVRLPGNNGQRVIGWGIRVNETLSWSTLLFSILVVLIAIGISVILYAKITLDNSSAFSLGSFAVALLTVYLTYQYFAWKENI